MKKRIAVMITVCIFGITSILGIVPFHRAEEARALSGGQEVRAVWLSYVDFSSLGMKTNRESTFRAKASAFLNKAKSNQLNTVYFHVRAFDDAAWKSPTFKAMSSLTSKASSKKKAKDTYSFDPLKIMVELAHSKGMELHAWMNPYRISMDYYLDPAYESSTKRIETAVREVMAYDVDGIHFDDYFYHAKKGYKNRDNDKILKVSQDPSASKKRSNVNQMVKSVYRTVKSSGSDAAFGISPQGNIENCRSAGADVDKWLSSSGYIDYIIPQIYWTNQWGSRGKTTMYTDRLKAWKKLNKNGTDMYIGLASYRTGIKYSDDPGWKKKSTNLADQLNLLRSYGCGGYSLFSAKDLYRSGAKTELSNLSKMARRIPRISTARYNYKTIQVKWNKISGVSGYQIYRASSKRGSYKRVKTAGAGTTSFKNTRLKPGKRYYYKIRAYKGNTIYPFSSTSAESAKPKAPSNIRTVVGKRKIIVRWKKVSGVSGYQIYRSAKKSGKYKRIKTVGRGTSKFTNKRLKRGKRYYYKVRAYKKVRGKKIYSSYSSRSGKRVK